MPNRKLHFRTARQEENNRKRLGWAIFLTVFLLLFLASAFVVLRQTGVGSRLHKEKLDTGNTNIKKEFNVMIGGTTEEGKLLFIGRLHVDTSSGDMKVKMYNPNTVYKGKTYAQLYEGDSASADTLAREFGKSIGETMDRYAIINEISASNVGFDLGFTKVDVPKALEYKSSEYSLSLEKGEQELGGTDMFNYIRYCGFSQNSSGYRNQAKLVAAVIDQALNRDNAENGQRIFESLSDDMTTNLGIGDYANYAQWLNSISRASHSVDVG